MKRLPKWAVYVTSNNDLHVLRLVDGEQEAQHFKIETGLVLIDMEKQTVTQPVQVKVVA